MPDPALVEECTSLVPAASSCATGLEAAQRGVKSPKSLVRIARAFRYVDNLAAIGGWLNETTALAIMEVLWLQERCGIHGDLAEIGVFQGKSFLALAAGASVGERLIAVDIFDSLDVVAQRPEHDVTDYGQGNEARFRANLAEYFPGTEVTVIARSSSDLRGQEREFGLTNLRFLSIDGGHTSQLTVNDLRIADSSLTEDGLCCLDDVLNPHWLGVISGLFEFLQSGPALVPVALFPNKLFLSRPARKHFYGDAFRRLFPETLERENVELHRSDVDVFGDTWPRMSATLNALTAAAAGANPAAATAGKLSTLAHTEAETRTAAAEARAFVAEAAARTATDRANRAERKLVKRKSRRAWAFRFGRAERAARPDQTRADALSDEGFDEPWYLRTYPDVAAAIACGDFPSGLAHFRIHGLREGRRRSAVDAGAPGGSCDAASSADDRRRQISAVWSANAAERAARCGWYWLAHPMVVARVNTLISGDPGCDAYGRLERLLRERGWNLPIPRAVSLGCGFGNLERDLAQRGLVQDIAGYDLAEGAVAEARRLACEAGLDALRYHVADLDALSFEKASLDAVFAHQAVHHVEKLESLCASVRVGLRPGGIFHLHEFVGPTRFQWTDSQLAAVNGFLSSLPPELRRLPDGQQKPLLQRPSIEAMIAADPSEAVRSADILGALNTTFEILERREIGGTLVHLALGDIAQNFAMAEREHVHHLQRMFDLEDRLLADGTIGSDFVVVTATPRPS